MPILITVPIIYVCLCVFVFSVHTMHCTQQSTYVFTICIWYDVYCIKWLINVNMPGS